MAKYLIRGNYRGDGIKGLMKDGGSKRRQAAAAAIESVGGTLDCLYYAFGDTDIFAICDLPDVASATAISLAINSSGAVAINLDTADDTGRRRRSVGQVSGLSPAWCLTAESVDGGGHFDHGASTS